jgi:hypothetical protein
MIAIAASLMLFNVLTCFPQDQRPALLNTRNAALRLSEEKTACCLAGFYLSNFDCSDSCRVATVSRLLRLKSSGSLKKEKEAELISLLGQSQASNTARATACFVLGEWRSAAAAPFLVDLLGTDLLEGNTKNFFYRSDAAGALIKLGKSINPLLIKQLQSDKSYAAKQTLAIILFRNLNGNKPAFESILKKAGENQPAWVKTDLERLLTTSQQWTLSTN